MSAAAEFVERFEAYWRAPTPQGLEAILAPQARLVAPLTATTHTREEGIRAFAALFELVEEMNAELHRWGPTDDGVLIEFTVTGKVGGKPISWHAVDRFVIDAQGLASERVSYFDSTPIALTLAGRPRAWPAFLRSRLRR